MRGKRSIILIILLVFWITETTSYGAGLITGPLSGAIVDAISGEDSSGEDSSDTEHGGGGHSRGDEDSTEGTGSPVIDFDYQDYQPANQQGYDKAIDWAGSILGTLRNIGVIVAIIALMIIGVKYMIGSVEQKAQYKQTLIPLAIGILMLVAGTVLVSLIYEIFV